MTELSGVLIPVSPFLDAFGYEGISMNVSTDDREGQWYEDDIFYAYPLVDNTLGPLDSSHLPIEFVHGEIPGEALVDSGSEWWERGLTLLLRHI